MKLPLSLIFILLFASALSTRGAEVDVEHLPISTLLERLDDAIEHKLEYQANRSHHADSLRQVALSTSGEERISAYRAMFETYLNFKTDSALFALECLRLLPEYAVGTDHYNHYRMDLAEVYGLMGFYRRAFDILDSIPYLTGDRNIRLHYFNTMHSVLGWRADYALKTVPGLAPELQQEAAVWHDSLLLYEPEPANRTIISTNRAYDLGQYQQCIDTLLYLLDQYNTRQRTFAYSRLAQAYGKTGEAALELRYLILTSIDDIQSGITEYMALPELAMQLYKMGEVERANDYLICALEDANTCKSNLRTIEVSTIYPIINQARLERIEHERFTHWLIIIILVISALILVGVILILIKFNNKLNFTRHLLAKANNDLKISNGQLQSANRELLLSDKIKGDYLMNYLARSHSYLSSIQSFQHQVLKLVQSRSLDELTRKLKSTDFVDEELEKFYSDFDTLFLSLYPNFVEKFNSLLRPEAAILPKKGELLTTELRIFALIRMGETDSTKIAKFLNYSLTTIYNYRSRVRNNALCDKDTFEQQVMTL